MCLSPRQLPLLVTPFVGAALAPGRADPGTADPGTASQPTNDTPLRVERPTVAANIAQGSVGDSPQNRQGLRAIATDNRTGVPAEICGRFVAPFFSAKLTGSGTDLSLSMSCDIVAQNPSSMLSFEDDTGGAAFVVRLPAPAPSSTTTDTSLASTLLPEP